jgi:iron(III) transport system substrate-binding protein
LAHAAARALPRAEPIIKKEIAMKNKINRRDILKGSTALALGTMFATRVLAQAPPAEAITPQLIEAAKKEGKVVWYTSIDLSVSEKVGAAFKAKFGIEVRAERTGAERVFQRIGQEYASNVHAVDVANSSDAAHLLAWKRQGILLPYVPEDVAKYYKPEHRDADGTYAGFRATLSPIAYNTKLVKAEDAPASFKDLLDPKWKGKIVKAHPGYSGTILTATFEMVRDIGWDYYEALAKQNVMQVQSATDPPKKLSLGERSVMADGTEYNIFLLKESGQPVEAVYPTEGTPFIVGPNGIFKDGPNPNAAKLFQNYCFTPEAQQIIIESGGLRSLHPQVKEHSGRKPLADIKLMKEDAEGAEKASEEIKARYQKLFRV